MKRLPAEESKITCHVVSAGVEDDAAAFAKKTMELKRTCEKKSRSRADYMPDKLHIGGLDTLWTLAINIPIIRMAS